MLSVLAPRCETVTRLHPEQVPSGPGRRAWDPPYFRPSCHVRNFIVLASWHLGVMNSLRWSKWSFSTETLVMTYKTIVRHILNIVAPIPYLPIIIAATDFPFGNWSRKMNIRTRAHRVIILLERAYLHNRIGRNWCKFSRPECATSQSEVTWVCALIG